MIYARAHPGGGVDLIDWNRIDQKDLADVEYTIKALKNECVRHHFWEHVEVDEKALKKARKIGPEGIREWAEKRIKKYVAPAQKDIFRDGTQTPFVGNIVYYAQHATGVCCRKCIEEGYNIDRHRPLSEEEINYFLDLLMIYI
jgi:hypothetical protein